MMITTARELHDIIISEVVKQSQKKGGFLRNHDVLTELALYGVTRPRVYRVFKALTAAQFLRRGHVEGEYLANDTLTSRPEKEVSEAAWKWLKGFDRTKNKGITTSEQVFLQMHRQPSPKTRLESPSTVKPPVDLPVATLSNGGDKSKNITALVEAMKVVQSLKNNLRPDGLLDAMNTLIEEVDILKGETDQLRKELAIARSDVGQLKTKLRVMSEDYTTLTQERDNLLQENATLHGKLANGNR